MGVSSLQTYVEKRCPEVIRHVDIRDLASQAQKAKPGKFSDIQVQTLFSCGKF
jgi:hypothetical protein